MICDFCCCCCFFEAKSKKLRKKKQISNYQLPKYHEKKNSKFPNVHYGCPIFFFNSGIVVVDKNRQQPQTAE
jgi:hypothetical protein